VSDQGKTEQRDSSEREDGGDRVAGVLVVGTDRALARDDRRDATDGRADGQQRRELAAQPESLAHQQDHRGGDGHVDEDDAQAEAAELGQVTQHETSAQQHDADFEPEFVGSDTRSEQRGHADRVSNDQAENDRPQHIFQVRQRGVGGFTDTAQPVLCESTDHTDHDEQDQPR
jgi:hypothetical protein